MYDPKPRWIYGELVDQLPVLNVKDEVFEKAPECGSGAE
jgi:hypothetical protein